MLELQVSRVWQNRYRTLSLKAAPQTGRGAKPRNTRAYYAKGAGKCDFFKGYGRLSQPFPEVG